MKQGKIKRIRTEEEKDRWRRIYFKVALSVFLVALFLVFFMLGNGWLYFYDTGYVEAVCGQDFQFHVINVGQGDCFLIKFPDDKIALIDCGDEDAYSTVKGYVNKLMSSENLSKIDYFILTHQDSDHIGCAYKILNDFDVDIVYRPKVYSSFEQENGLVQYAYSIYDGNLYNNFTIALIDNNIDYVFNERGLEINGGDYYLQFLSPKNNTYSASNDYSAVIMLKILGKKFLLTGDATNKIENELIEEYGNNLKADVLKVAHHGSNTSSSEDFLSIVNPEVAILSVGENNNNLPNVNVLNRLYNLNTTIYSTKKLGSFAFMLDEGELKIKTHPIPSSSLPFIACLIILLISFVWGINFNRKHSQKG